MRVLVVLSLSVFLCLGTGKPARAEGEQAGEFDYWVLSLSWQPTWCALEGDARGAESCDEDFGWVLHGLWPQYHRGYPSYCPTTERPPSRRMTADMADIMGSGGLAWHQWKKHGVCAGIGASSYFRLSREAYGQITRPPVFRQLDRSVKLPAAVVEEAFLKANPDLEADMLTITCRDGFIQEARVCLSRNLDPVPCGADVIRDCRQDDARFDPIR